MGTPSYKNRVGMTVTGTPGTGTITLNAAETGYQSFATAYGANANVDILIEEGNAWEIARDCTYTHSGTTITRGTLEASSTGSALSLTSAAKVYVIDSAQRIYHAALSSRGHIEGGLLAYSSTTAITVSACKLDVNGVIRETSGTTTLTSGSTMKDLAGNTVTIGASKAYFVFAYNNAGTLEFRVEDRDGTGDGADPAWDADLDYWKAASTGAEARRIGKFWTNASSQIIAFKAFAMGRCRGLKINGHANTTTRVLSAGTQTTFQALTITPFLTGDDSLMYINLAIDSSSSTTSIVGIISTDGGTETNGVGRVQLSAVSGTLALSYFPFVLPYTGTLHYKCGGSNTRMYVDIEGFEQIV